jgi:hypothetical protein
MVFARHQVSAGNTFHVPYVVTQDTGDGNLTEEGNTYLTVYSRRLYEQNVR